MQAVSRVQLELPAERPGFRIERPHRGVLLRVPTRRRGDSRKGMAAAAVIAASLLILLIAFKKYSRIILPRIHIEERGVRVEGRAEPVSASLVIGINQCAR